MLVGPSSGEVPGPATSRQTAQVFRAPGRSRTCCPPARTAGVLPVHHQRAARPTVAHERSTRRTLPTTGSVRDVAAGDSDDRLVPGVPPMAQFQLDPERDPWDRQPGESADQYEWFLHYRNDGERRTLARVAQRF